MPYSSPIGGDVPRRPKIAAEADDLAAAAQSPS
jgi:hypothetical protein